MSRRLTEIDSQNEEVINAIKVIIDPYKAFGFLNHPNPEVKTVFKNRSQEHEKFSSGVVVFEREKTESDREIHKLINSWTSDEMLERDPERFSKALKEAGLENLTDGKTTIGSLQQFLNIYFGRENILLLKITVTQRETNDPIWKFEFEYTSGKPSHTDI